MHRIYLLLFLFAVCFAAAMQAQAPAPKPDPELKKLHALLGHWTYEGEYTPGPLGPGGKITGEYTAQMILGGFYLQARYTEKGATGEVRSIEINGYDPLNKNFTSNMYSDDGTRFSGVVTASGNTLTWEGKWVIAGKQYQFKEPFIMAADRMSGTAKAEISADGKTWTPCFEGTYTKVKPAPKK
jgi:hypothetical protein